ncbi:3-oxoacyl-[acyl-carrier-protein] synthase III chloroplastic [Bienertia sinuspersici]
MLFRVLLTGLIGEPAYFFGDAAGALIVQQRCCDSLKGFPPKSPSYSCTNTNGKEVFRFWCSIEAALQKAGLSGPDIDCIRYVQTNQRIIDSVAARLEVPSERALSNLANYGASIPLALDEAVWSGKVQPGPPIIATSGFGAGLVWGSAIIIWG